MASKTTVQAPTPWKPLFANGKFVSTITIVGLLLSAGVFAAHWSTGALGLGTIAAIAYTLYATAVTGVDAVVHRLPNVFTLPAAALSVLWAGFVSYMEKDPGVLVAGLVGGGIVFGCWYLLALIANVGWGDVKFVFAGAVLLGMEGWQIQVMGSVVWLLVLMIAVLLVSLMHGKRGNDQIPQGPTIALAVVAGLAFPLMFG